MEGITACTDCCKRSVQTMYFVGLFIYALVFDQRRMHVIFIIHVLLGGQGSLLDAFHLYTTDTASKMQAG